MVTAPEAGRAVPSRVPRIAALACPNCGAAVERRTFGHAVTVVCPSCAAVLDARHEDVRIVEVAASGIREPIIPLGTRGQWGGAPYEVIGWQRRGIEVEGTTYAWDEFLLFNPYRGFRYLTQYEGHWNDIAAVTRLPKLNGGGRPLATYDGRRFKHFQKARARTSSVLGEFPWEVRTGDEVEVDDFIAPPRILSREETPDEVAWSLGEYVEGERVWKAFRLKGSPPARTGVYANQPNARARRLAGFVAPFFLAAALVIGFGIARNAFARNDVVYRTTGRVTPPRAAVFVTPEFDLEGGDANVALKLGAPGLDNNWMAVTASLIDARSGRAVDIPADVSYYHGVSDGERWSEGRRSREVVVPGIPGGRYYLRVEAEPGPAPAQYHLTLTRDVPLWRYTFVAFLLLLVPVVLVGLSALSFENARWAESDYPWSSNDE